MRASAAYYPALTGVRALAAFAVFAYHYGSFLLPARSAAARLAVGELNIGVSVFFTLSGFLMARRYAGQPLGRRGWRRYLVHRAARILPVYWLLAALSVVLHLLRPATHPLWGSSWLYLASLTLLKGFAERWYLTGLPQAWSLTVEECFYLLAPAVFWLGRRSGPGRAWPLVAAAMLATGLGLYRALPALGSLLFMLKATIFGRLPEFLLGAGFAWAAPPRWLRGRATWVGGTGFAAVWLGLVALHAGSQQNTLDSLPGLFAHTWLLPVATGCLLVGLATEATWLRQLLSTRPWQVLGQASYCFYLLHLGIIPNSLLPRLPPWLPPPAVAGCLFGAVLLASLLLHRYWERPAYRWLVARFASGQSPAAATLPSVSRAQ